MGAGAGDDLPAKDAEAVEGRRCPDACRACAASGGQGQGQGQSPCSGRGDVDVEGEVDVDVVSMDAGECFAFVWLAHLKADGYHLASRRATAAAVNISRPTSISAPPCFRSPLALQLSGAPSPSTDFAPLNLMMPYPGATGPRPA
jgi:hypothetical protein